MNCSPASTRRILLVASNENFRRTISRILCRCGYTTDVVGSGEEAMGALEREQYDLVLSEVLLPGACGLTVLCNARQHGRTVPFVLLSESVTERMKWILSGLDRVRCLRLPVDVDQLKQVLKSYLTT
ncbi:MAG: response regulator [Deltaproteobacteria bacterium]|nr:MAG: response regulator [Deltaproteobacteria bacterium]